MIEWCGKFYPDFTAIVESMAFGRKGTDLDCPAHQHDRTMLTDFRRRQKEGTATPSWCFWSEFDIPIGNEKVTVLYNPKWLGADNTAHFQFYGDAISGTGYLSHFIHIKPKINIVKWATEFAEELHADLMKGRVKEENDKPLKIPQLFPEFFEN